MENVNTKENTPEEKKTKRITGKKILNKEKAITYGLLIGTAIFTIAGIIVFSKGLEVGVTAVNDSYQSQYEVDRKKAFDARYEKYREKAEKEYHVQNRATISVSNIKDVANLEVLHVSDVEYVIENQKDNGESIAAWLEVPGSGVYVVDLQAAEFIFNDETSSVLVRAPYPELTNLSIDQANVKKLLFKNDLLNDSISAGEKLAQSQLAAGELLIKKEFASNQYFYKSAQAAAEKNIKRLVEQFNPEVPDLKVSVEFF